MPIVRRFPGQDRLGIHPPSRLPAYHLSRYLPDFPPPPEGVDFAIRPDGGVYAQTDYAAIEMAIVERLFPTGRKGAMAGNFAWLYGPQPSSEPLFDLSIERRLMERQIELSLLPNYSTNLGHLKHWHVSAVVHDAVFAEPELPPVKRKTYWDWIREPAV